MSRKDGCNWSNLKVSQVVGFVQIVGAEINGEAVLVCKLNSVAIFFVP
jgi:hypothetical protein